MALETLFKQPGESRLYTMDFSANMSSAETLASVVSVTADTVGITIGTPVYSGKNAQVRISGGTSGAQHKLTWVVTTSSGNTLEADGYLKIENF